MNTKIAKANQFIRAITACFAAFTGSCKPDTQPTPKPAHQRESKPNLSHKSREVSPKWTPPESRLAVNEINWVWRNQRQDRKARRRRWAAWDRHAFAR